MSHARTKATFAAAIHSWLKIHDADANTLAGYETHARLYVKPALGGVPIGKVTAQMLEELYAELRRCRVFCFQAEDGIRGGRVTGVQTCALPICAFLGARAAHPRRLRAGWGADASGGA